MAWITNLGASTPVRVEVSHHSGGAIDLDLVRADGETYRTITLRRAELLELLAQITMILAELVDTSPDPRIPLDAYDPPERWIAETGAPDPEATR